MLTILAILVAALLLCGVLWQFFTFVRYVRSGEYETDKRLWKISE